MSLVHAFIASVLDSRAKHSRRVAIPRGFTARRLCTTDRSNPNVKPGVLHKKQFAAITDKSRYQAWLASRRAGKTNGIANRFALNSVAKPNGKRVYLALTASQARDIIWTPIWKPLCAKYHLCTEDDHNEQRMVTTFPNGSIVKFGGTDDIRRIKAELGAGLDEACVDEGQDQPDEVLVDLVDRILSNTLTDRRGTLIVMGVVPEVEAGKFWDIWDKSNWSKHNFSQMENPFMYDPMGELLEYLEKNPGLNIESPIIQRERFGKFKFDRTLTAYTYTPELNGYTPELPEWFDGVADWMKENYPDANVQFLERTTSGPARKARYGLLASKPHKGITQFAASVDQGRGDRVSINVIGWGSETPEVQHVAEWSTPRNASMVMSQIAPVMALFQLHFDIQSWSMDGVVNEIDTMATDYGLGLIRAPLKTDRPGQVKRQNDLLTTGKAQIMEGSATEEDLMKARWDKGARGRGKYEWATQWHPDPAESWRYAHALYNAEYVPPEAPKPDTVVKRERAAKRAAKKLNQKIGRRSVEEVEETMFTEEDGEWT